MYFLIEDDGLLEKYNAIWFKVSADMKKKTWWRVCLQWGIFKNKSKISWGWSYRFLR